ncbi:MAG: hypothetical protein K6U74_18660 [Firmicutes bacterium]|nr:hypothetical protein [Bacillota bacterium]
MGIFLNNRTTKDGYINTGQPSTRLSSTQLNDLRLAVRYLQCRYGFGTDDMADFLGIAEELVKKAFKDLPCLTCPAEKRKKVNDRMRRRERERPEEEWIPVVRTGRRKARSAGFR